MKTNDIPKAHPSLLDALRRQDEKAQQMKLSEGFEERVMGSLPKNRSPRLRLNRIAAIFLAAAFLGSLTWAISPLIRQKGKTPQSAKVTAPSLTRRAGGESGGGGLLIFTDVRLDSMLAIVSQHYGKAVFFGDEELKALRIHTKWNREDSLAAFIENLNELDELSLTEQRDTIFVQKGGAQ